MLFLCAGCHNRPAAPQAHDAAAAAPPPVASQRTLPVLPPVPLPGAKSEPPSPHTAVENEAKREKPAKPSTDKTPMECKPASTRLCNVSLGDSAARCTINGLQSCTSDGRWDVCRGSCTTSYYHYGHPLHCEDRHCRTTRRCERSGYLYATDRCEDTHSPAASTRVCCPNSDTRSCSVSCYGGGGSCMIAGSSTCDYSGHWGSCHGQCSYVPYGGGVATCSVH